MTESEFNRAREELLENISELFLKYGLRSTSMDDICSHLKISKKTLYQYFSNKDDLVEQIMMHRRNNYRTQKDIEELKQHNSVEIMLTIRDHIIRSQQDFQHLSTICLTSQRFNRVQFNPKNRSSVLPTASRIFSQGTQSSRNRTDTTFCLRVTKMFTFLPMN